MANFANSIAPMQVWGIDLLRITKFKTVKKNLFLALALLLGANLWLAAQKQVQPVHWTTDVEILDNPDEFMLIFNATIDNGWYLYSQNTPDGGPLPASFDFASAKDIKLLGKVEEIGKVKDVFDPIFEVDVKKYADKVTFKAKVKSLKPKVQVEIPLDYMSCNDQACVKLAEFFEFTLASAAKPAATPATTPAENPQGNAPPATSGSQTTVSLKTTSGGVGTVTAAANVKATSNTQNTASSATQNTPPTAVAPLAGNITNPGGDIVDPVKWRYDKQDLGNGEYLLRITATLDNGWYIYSQNIADGGPVPTTFTFKESPDVQLLGADKLQEVSSHKKEGFDPIFKMKVTKFAQEVTFEKKVKLANPDAPVFGEVEFMTCDDTRCLPPAVEEFAFNAPNPDTANAPATGGDSNLPSYMQQLISMITHCGIDTEGEKRSLLTTFILGFLGGFAALLTPCVFPMVPLTVSFFTKRSKNRRKGLINAIIYAISIIVIYVALGFSITAAFGPSTLNVLATDPWFNIAFFALFLIFAISFFGYFEINPPSWLVNRASDASDRGGLLGIFFMAFTLALTSFSCTGPIIGTLLVDAAVGGERLGPVIGMTGFSMALALPFALFAMFPGWLNSLPKSGGWLNTVKVVLGFIELIFALKFLSNADLVKQWWLLPRELFLGIWILLFLGMAAYLAGFIKFPHDSPIKKISIPRGTLAFASLAFALYLVPGIFCKQLNLVSGFPPPISYSWTCEGAKVEAHIKDLEEAMTIAKKEGKPILVDFTGWACVNCRKMEENVWPDVADLIDKYTLVSLYVDEKAGLPEEQQFEYKLGEKKQRVRTVGDKWSFVQTHCFASNTQPYYVLLNDNGELLNAPVGYMPNIADYTAFLKKGLDNYKDGKTAIGQR